MGCISGYLLGTNIGCGCDGGNLGRKLCCGWRRGFPYGRHRIDKIQTVVIVRGVDTSIVTAG